MTPKAQYVKHLLIISLSALFFGCATSSPKITEIKRSCPVETMAVAPFQSAIQTEGNMGVVDPVTAEIHRGGVVTEDAATFMTTSLSKVLDDHFVCKLIFPRQLADYLPSKPKGPGFEVQKALSRAGAQSGAQVVLVGSLLRYTERMGGNYGINKPASVYFGLYLIDVKSSKIVWKGFFDETQTSLSENLLTAGKFIERGGRWLTAAELAEYGLHETIKRLPASLSE
jgi:hypothetical protein